MLLTDWGDYGNARLSERVCQLGFVARLVAFAARKVQVSLAVRASLRSLAAAGPNSVDTAAFDARVAALEAVRARLPAVRIEFQAVWLRHARRSEIHLTLEAFDALDARFGFALEWQRGREDLRRLAELGGSPP